MTWTDTLGNFWLFGGGQAPTTYSDTYLNDLWKYSQGQWTWMGGASSSNQSGVYGTSGVASAGNTPGGRTSAAGWTDASGDLWLFGGLGLNISGMGENMNDFWKYSGGQWTWIGGSAFGHVSGVYGTQGVASADNIPGGRSSAVTWTDASGNGWLFGGWGTDANGNDGYLNDLWKYSAGKWTWMSGSNLVNQSAVYGTRGVAALGNVPAARVNAVGWIDASGSLWLFGGSFYNETISGTTVSTSFETSNEMWRYSAGQWAWMGGSTAFNQPGTYGTLATASSSNTPGSRVLALAWTDSSGDFWLFGGDGFDANGQCDALNDLWKYSAGQWTWIGGSNAIAQPGTYGTSATHANVPGGRQSSIGWKDATGNLFLFGGQGYDSSGKFGYLNDFWKYEP